MNSNFETRQRQTAEKLTARYDKRITKLNKMLEKALNLTSALERDYKAHVAVPHPEGNQPLTPIQTAQFIVRDIQALVPIIARERDYTENDIMETIDHNDLEVVEACAKRQLSNYSWDIRNLKKPLQAFKDGYGSGVEAYIMSRLAWRERYI